MEQIASLYDSTANENFFTFAHQDVALSDKETNNIMLQFSMTLELEQLMPIFLNQLVHRTGLVGLSLDADELSWQRGRCDSGTTCQRLDAQIGGKQIARLSYHFAGKASLPLRQRIAALHGLFRRPLKNSLDYERIKRLATRDHLTGLGNRASFDDMVERFIRHARRHDSVFSLVMMDLNKFKPVNDVYGHQTGDRVLAGLGQILTVQLRDADFAFRFGGDEFCCLLSDADQIAAQRFVQRIHMAMINDPLLSDYGVSASIGIATLQQRDNKLSLIKRADQALYQQKFLPCRS